MTKRNCEKLLGSQNVLRNHYIAILFNPVLQVCPSVPLLVFTALSMIHFPNVLSGYFYVSLYLLAVPAV